MITALRNRCLTLMVRYPCTLAAMSFGRVIGGWSGRSIISKSSSSTCQPWSASRIILPTSSVVVVVVEFPRRLVAQFPMLQCSVLVPVSPLHKELRVPERLTGPEVQFVLVEICEEVLDGKWEGVEHSAVVLPMALAFSRTLWMGLPFGADSVCPYTLALTRGGHLVRVVDDGGPAAAGQVLIFSS